jgi:hypothetical protein
LIFYVDEAETPFLLGAACKIQGWTRIERKHKGSDEGEYIPDILHGDVNSSNMAGHQPEGFLARAINDPFFFFFFCMMTVIYSTAKKGTLYTIEEDGHCRLLLPGSVFKVATPMVSPDSQ